MNQINYENIFPNANIKVVNSNEFFFIDVPNVDMDKMLAAAGKAARLGTDSLSACFAFCSRGATAEGIPVIGLWHKTPLIQGDKVIKGLSVLTQLMQKLSCNPATIETFVVGGLGPDQNDDGSEDEERELINMAKRQNFKDMLFNYGTEEEPLSVVLTPETVYVSKGSLFESEDYAGIPFQ